VPVPSPEDLEDSVVWSVIRAAHVLEREVTALFAGFDLSPVQFGVLSYLGANGPMTTSALARSVLVRPQSLTGVIASLEQRGVVERPGARGRGRASPVTLTAAGQHLLAAVWPAFATADQAVAAALPQQQAAALTTALHRLLTAPS
jgi:DNA-binding MarR family transcriptional regulator